jgi:hypothetical protein
MIQVNLASEPSGFNAAVRQKGLSAIDEMVGRRPRLQRSGPRRLKIAEREQDIPADKFPPYWRDCLDELLQAYDRRCAFLALYLEHATGNPSVDHMLPKSKRWDQVYEWNNYRVCTATINSRKSDLQGIVDPVDCRTGWFALEFVGFQVTAGDLAPAERQAAIHATLELVNTRDCCRAREEYVTSYLGRDIPLSYLERRAPFIASELRRQNRLLPGDT